MLCFLHISQTAEDEAVAHDNSDTYSSHKLLSRIRYVSTLVNKWYIGSTSVWRINCQLLEYAMRIWK